MCPSPPLSSNSRGRSRSYEKFEAHAWWYGAYLMAVRLLETSLLVFFAKRSTKATVGTAIAVISLTIAQKYKPWLRESDDEVSALY